MLPYDGFKTKDTFKKDRFTLSKVYTSDEVRILNLLLHYYKQRKLSNGEGHMDEDTINVIDQNIIIYLPRLDGIELPARINWLRQLEGDFYIAGLTYIEHGSPTLMCTEWMLKRDNEVGFLPMFCSLQWDGEEVTISEEEEQIVRSGE